MFVLLRIVIGWHFLREGVIKFSHPTWSAVGYLKGSWGPFSPLFNAIADNPTLLQLSDYMMPIMLTAAGVGLMLGLFTRLSTLLSMGLLVMFYCAAPPMDPSIVYDPSQVFNFPMFMSQVDHAQWAGKHLIGTEGNYVVVNKNMVEFFALGALLMLNTGRMAGLDVLIHQYITGPYLEKKTAQNAE
ncbi:MAG: DoxX family membrane protein [bacterium]|nr:DoxX family membrane protein [bacterium]